jgi:iron complex outermembrane receptor protein
MLSYSKPFSSPLISYLKIWTSYTRNNFTFNRYIKNQQDFSYKSLTGVSPNMLVSGVDLKSKIGFYINTTFSYVDAIPLNDANTDFASSYFIVGSRVGYSSQAKNFPFDVWLGIDNATDQTYSLGNDLNAVGGRYYNAAAGRNWYVGASVGIGY